MDSQTSPYLTTDLSTIDHLINISHHSNIPIFKNVLFSPQCHLVESILFIIDMRRVALIGGLVGNPVGRVTPVVVPSKGQRWCRRETQRGDM